MREPSHGAMPWRTLKSHQEDIDACPRVANKSVGNIGGTGYYYTNVICVFAMANFVLQLCKTRYLENCKCRHKIANILKIKSIWFHEYD